LQKVEKRKKLKIGENKKFKQKLTVKGAALKKAFFVLLIAQAK